MVKLCLSQSLIGEMLNPLYCLDNIQPKGMEGSVVFAYFCRYKSNELGSLLEEHELRMTSKKHEQFVDSWVYNYH